MLIEEGIITREQLDDALSKQKLKEKAGIKSLVGQTLVELGYCTEDDISRVVAKQSGVQLLSFSNFNVDLAAANLITPEIAEKYKVLPIGFENNRLLLAMKNPGDVIAIDDLRIITGYDIKPVVINDKELDTVLKRFKSLSSMLQDSDKEKMSKGNEVEVFDESFNDINTRPAVQLTNQIINQAVRAGASDIHVEPQEKFLRVRYRIDGVLHEVMQHPIDLHPALSSRIKVMANMDIAERRLPQDGRTTLNIEGNIIDVRVATIPTAYGEKITMRLLNRSDRLFTLAELGFNQTELEEFKKTIQLPYGFVLISGPTGSGKSTTLYVSLEILNKPDKNIITIEDPIERKIEGVTQVQVNTKAGITFASGLRSILRNDPDIIMVGEIRDYETSKIAVESALTGHMVFSTIHTNDAAGAITRLIDMGIEPYLISSSLVGVVAQRLARILCEECKQPVTVTRQHILSMIPDFPLEEGEKEIKLYKAKGCPYCNNTGYKGRIGIFEFLKVTETIQKLMLIRASAKQMRDSAIKEGMQTMRQNGFLKAKEGITTVEEVLRVII